MSTHKTNDWTVTYPDGSWQKWDQGYYKYIVFGYDKDDDEWTIVHLAKNKVDSESNKKTRARNWI